MSDESGAPIKISASLLGLEWSEARKSRNEDLSKLLQAETGKELTFKPSINDYPLPDRSGDVIENLRRKEASRVARLNNLKMAAAKVEVRISSLLPRYLSIIRRLLTNTSHLLPALGPYYPFPRF